MWLALAALAGCSSGDDTPARKHEQTPRAPAVSTDAGVAAAKSAPAPKPAKADEGDVGFLDPPPGQTKWHAAPEPVRRNRPEKIVHLTLRSTPANAQVLVDNERVGHTPTYWEGPADGKPHDFVFILPGYAVARYRFVPIQDGHVHPRLERLVKEEPDAGAPAAPAPVR